MSISEPTPQPTAQERSGSAAPREGELRPQSLGRRTVDASEVKHALSHFATGVTVVTSLSSEAEPVGTTASAVSSLSLEPPLLLVCLARKSATLAALRVHRAFAVNVLAAGQHELSGHFARSGRAAGWSAVAHHVSHDGLPLIAGALASVECAVERFLDGGYHEIVIGRVRGLTVDTGETEPLLHYRGSYAAISR
jgi:flavin reductase (DIM6/NTAB) family NADH-FMN oxidoreductase RutF